MSAVAFTTAAFDGFIWTAIIGTSIFLVFVACCLCRDVYRWYKPHQ